MGGIDGEHAGMVSVTVRWIPATKLSILQSGYCTRISATLHNEESSSVRFPPLVLKTAALRFRETNRSGTLELSQNPVQFL